LHLKWCCSCCYYSSSLCFVMTLMPLGLLPLLAVLDCFVLCCAWLYGFCSVPLFMMSKKYLLLPSNCVCALLLFGDLFLLFSLVFVIFGKGQLQTKYHGTVVVSKWSSLIHSCCWLCLYVYRKHGIVQHHFVFWQDYELLL